jgi:GxxExxY protein
MATPLLHRDTTQAVLDAFYEVYNTLGFGFLESVYAAALERELLDRGLEVVREFGVTVVYKGAPLSNHRLDFLVDECVVIELKAGPALPPTAEVQLRNYLRATNLEVGLLLWFGPEPRFKRLVAFNRSA